MGVKMSESKVDGVEPKQTDGVHSEESTATESKGSADQDKVAYETYKRTLEQLKKTQAALREKEAQEKERKLKEAQEQGKFQELMEAYKKEAEEAKAQMVELKKSYGATQVKSQLQKVLMSEGCIDIDEVIQLTDWSGKINVDPETFAVKEDDIKKVVEEWKKKKPNWFKTTKANVQHVNVGSKPVVSVPKPASIKELALQLANKSRDARK
jgi:hypothetical protein